jgi:hypothetical protein
MAFYSPSETILTVLLHVGSSCFIASRRILIEAKIFSMSASFAQKKRGQVTLPRFFVLFHQGKS